MTTKTHITAAEQHEQAAKHHRDAAKLIAAGKPEAAAPHIVAAGGHLAHATQAYGTVLTQALPAPAATAEDA
jgi:hypothetical protein